MVHFQDYQNLVFHVFMDHSGILNTGKGNPEKPECIVLHNCHLTVTIRRAQFLPTRTKKISLRWELSAAKWCKWGQGTSVFNIHLEKEISVGAVSHTPGWQVAPANFFHLKIFCLAPPSKSCCTRVLLKLWNLWETPTGVNLSSNLCKQLSWWDKQNPFWGPYSIFLALKLFHF